MFKFTVGNPEQSENGKYSQYDGEVGILDCPATGLKAVDFRRANGLPDGADAHIKIPSIRVISEAIARKFPEKLSEACDCNASYPGTAEPEAIAAYIANPSENTLLGLLNSAWTRVPKITADREGELARRKEEARGLLAEELAKLVRRAEKAEARAEAAEAELTSREEEEVEVEV